MTEFCACRWPPPPSLFRLQPSAERYAQKILEALDYAGVICLELFELNGQLLANEIAPRVHNSGHWSIEGAATSQFENHLRAILAMPLGSTATMGFSAMINLIGELPCSEDVLRVRNAHLHLYGKSPRPGRKLGHVTLRADKFEKLQQRLGELPSFFHGPEFCLAQARAESLAKRA